MASLFNLDPTQFRVGKGPGVRLVQKVDSSQAELGKLLSALPRPVAPTLPTLPTKPDIDPATLPKVTPLEDSVINQLNSYKTDSHNAFSSLAASIKSHVGDFANLQSMSPEQYVGYWYHIGPYANIRGPGYTRLPASAYTGNERSLIETIDNLDAQKNTNVSRVKQYQSERSVFDQAIAPYKDQIAGYNKAVNERNSTIEDFKSKVDSYNSDYSRIAQDFNNSRQQFGTVDQKAVKSEGDALADSALYSDNLHQLMLDRISAANAEPILDQVSSLFAKGK